MDILELFKEQLLKNPSTSSKSTLKNYLSDVRHFISWFERSTKDTFEATKVTTDIILLYEKTLGGVIDDGRLNPSTQLSIASLKRHLSSLRKFFAVLEKEKYISQNPFTQIQPAVNETPTDLWHLNSFKDALLLQKASKITVKNYLSDISGFAKWYEETILPGLEKPLSATGGFYLITQGILEDYRKRLLEVQNAAPRTVNRKLSALRRYLNFVTEKGFVSLNELSIDPVRVFEERINMVDSPTVELTELPAAAKKEKTYSKFPPVRLLQKLVIFPYLTLEEKTATSIATFISGKPLNGLEKLPPKLASIVEAKNIVRSKTNSVNNILGIRNVSKEFYAPDKVSLLGTPLYKRLIYHAKFTRPNWYKRYHNYSFVHYVHFALLVIFASGVGVALYQNLVAKKQTPTFAAATAPPRIISFQGRLTDNLDNPITSTSALRFAIYNDSSASGGALLWQEAITNITPDQDGIFSILLGGGTQIPSTVFTDNSQIYLGVTVGTTPELSPRQRIASVGYATNSEFLQGQPPTTQAGITSFTNVILALDSSGNLTLADSGVTNHTFQVSNGAFNLKGQSLYLTTNTGSGGNVILSPDGLGKIDIQRPIINTTTMGNLVPGGVEVNDKFGILATESAVAAFIVNNNTTGGDILAASSSGTTRFRLANDGTLTDGVYNTAGGIFYGSNSSGTFAQTTAGSLGQCLQSTAGGTPTWSTCGSSDWRTNLGTLSPNNDTLDLLFGGSTTSSAKFRFVNINTGTPVASVSANSGNNSTFISGDGTLGTTNRQTLTIGNSSTYNTTGNLLFNPNGIGKIGIGTNAPLIGFDLRGNSGTAAAASISANTSFATLLVDNSGSGDLIAASASGVPNFIVKNNGDVVVGQGGSGKLTASVIDPYLVQNQKTTGIQSLTFQTLGATNADFIFKNASTTLSTLTQAGQLQLPVTGSTGGIVIGGDTQLFRGAADRLDVASGDSFNVVNGNLQIGGSTVIDSSRNGTFQTLNITGGCTGCTVGAPSPFQALSGAIVPLNGTLDLLVGSQASTSAKFSVLNISNGTPTASVSATSTGAGLSIAGDGTLQGTLNNNIVIGGNTTGAIQFKPNNSSVSMFLSGANVAIGNQNPQASLDISQNSHLSSAVDKILFGSIGNTIGVLGYDGAANDEIRIGAQSNKGLELLTNNTTQAYITNTGNFGIGTTTPTAKLDVNGTASVSGQLSLYSTPTIQSTAFQSLTLGGSTTGDIQFKPGNATNPTVYFQTGGNVGINTQTPSSLLTLNQASNTTANSISSYAFNLLNQGTANVTIGADATYTYLQSWASKPLQINNQGNNVLLTTNAGLVGIGATSPLAKLQVNGGNEGGNSAFIVNQTGLSTNDIFAASASGTTKFTIKNDGTASSSAGFTINGTGSLQSTKNQTLTIGGNSTGAIVLSPNNGAGTLQFTNFTTNGGILYTNAAGVLSQTGAGTSVQCLLGNLTWASCGTGTTTTPFYETLGAIVPFQGTEDFLLGAQATTSAKFSVLNINNGTPTASVSSGLNGTGAYFDANGNFRTANKMSLTLGGGNTGNITIQGNNTLYLIDQAINLSAINPTLSANGTSTLTLNNNSTGNIQFFSSSNTLTSAGALTIAGNATINGGTVQLANGAQGTIQTASNADIVITAGSGTINLNTVSNGAVLTGSGLTTLGGGLTVNGTTTTFGNAAPLITTGTNTDLTITPNGTGNLIITSDFNTGVRIGASTNTPAALSVSGGIGSNAGFILNRTGATDDIFAASSSGTTKFVIKNDGTASTSGNLVFDSAGSIQTTKNQTLTIGGTSTGNIRFANFSTNNGLLYTNGSGVLSQTGAGGSLQCLLGDLTWGSCGTGTSRSPFQELFGAIVQNNSTEDFLAGGQASTSAAFKVTGQGNPFAGTLVGASVSANTSFVGLLADNKGVGDLFAASSSGVTQFVIRNNGAVGIGTNIPGAMLDVNGNLLLGANSTIDARATGTLTIGNGANTTGLTLGKAGTTTTFNATSWTATPTISGLVTGTLGFSVASGQSYTGAGPVTLSSASNNDLTIVAQGSGNTIITSDFDTGVRIGASTNTPAALSVSGGIGSNAGFILNRVGSTDDIFSASASGVTKFTLKNDGTASSSAGFTINGVGNVQSTRNQTLTIGGSSTGTILLQPNNGSGNVGINNPNPFSALSVDGNIDLGTGVTSRQLTAYNAARTNHGALELYNLASGNLTLSTDFSTGNIVLTPGASGSIQMTNFTSNGGILYTNGSGVLSQVTAGSTSQCLFGGATPSFNNCAAGFSSPFREFSGTIIPLNSTEDFLIGGQASASAAFKVTGQANPFAGTLSAASVSANTSFAGFVVDQKGVGDIFTASSSGVPQFVVKNNGNVGIGLGTGTAGIPTAKLDVNGTASISSALTFRTGAGSIQTTAGNTLTLGGTTTGDIQFKPGNASTPSLYLKTGGNIGIGTTDPGTKLAFASSTSSTDGISFGSDTNIYRSATSTLASVNNLLVGSASTAINTGANVATTSAVDNTNGLHNSSASYSSVSIGSDGFYRIAYADGNNVFLNYVQCTNIDCSTKNNNVVDNVGHVHYPWLTMGNDGFGRIIYQDTNFNTLEFKRCTNAACTTGTKKTLNASGAQLDVPFKIGTDGFPRVVFTDQITGDLTYLQCTNADCTATASAVLNSANYSSLNAPFAIASDTFARMVYQDSGNGNMLFVQCTNASCSTKTTTTITSANFDSPEYFALGSDGFGRFIYGDGNTGDLVFVQCTNASCSTRNTTILDAGNYSSFNAFAFGSDGFPRILFADNGSGDLTFVQCTNASCSTSTMTAIDAGNNSYGYSMALDSNGYANIAFLDGVTSAVETIRCTNASCSTNSGKMYVDSGSGINMYNTAAVNGDGAFRFSYMDTNSYLILGIMSQTSYATDGNELYVAGDAGFNSNIYSDGSLYLAGDGQIGGNLSLNGNIRVNGTTNLASTLTTWGTSTFNSSVTMNGSLSVYSSAYISSTLTANSGIQVNSGNITQGSSSVPNSWSYNTSGTSNDVYVSGKYAYVADGSSGLQIIDIAYPSSPALVGTYDTSGTANGVYTSGKYAYVADDTAGLQIIDVSNPSAPTLVGTYNTPGTARKVYVSGKYAYVADDTAGLQIIDVSNPSAPTLVGTYNTPGTAYGVYVNGQYAYIADGSSGIIILYINNPKNPVFWGSYNTSIDARSVVVSGKYAYVADPSNGLRIIDISNAASPALTASYNPGVSPVDVKIAGNYAYITYSGWGIYIINIANPASPFGVTSSYSGGTSNALFAAGKYLYVAAGLSGLYIMDINGITTPALYAGNVLTNNLTVSENTDIGNNLYVKNALNIGQGGLLSEGSFTFNTATSSGNLIQGAPVGNALLTLNYQGNGQNIFVASSSGVMSFAIGHDGQVLFRNAAGDPSVALGAGAVYYNTTAQALKYYNGSAWSTIGSGGSSPFKEALGAIIANQPTEDFLLGGNATSSAKFAVLNLNSGTPTASVSATSTGKGISLAGDGTIQSLRNNTLVIGGSTTGDIAFTPGNTTAKNGLYLASNGNVSIGSLNAPINTLLPDPKFQIFSTLGTGSVASISARSSAAPVLLVTTDDANNGDLFVASVSGQPKFRIDTNGAVHAGGSYANDYGADVAEYYRKAYPDEQFQPGQLVCLATNGVTKCSNNPTQKIIGVVSDRAMLIGFGKYSNDPGYVLVGMVGQLGVWTTGDVKAGDALTFSSTPGVASVAKGEGNIIGYAQESNNNQLKRIETVIQPNYFNPNTALQTDTVFNSLTLGIQNGIYNVIDTFGNSINHIDAFSKAVIGNLTAGFASIQTLAVNTLTATTSSLGNATASTFAVAADTITIGGQDIRQFIIDTIRNAGFGQNTVTTPLATGSIKTNVISPLADNSSVQVNLNKDTIELKNTDTGKTVAWFSNQGNATISGQLTSEGIQTSNATVSGTLASGSIETTDASVAGTLTANTIIANNITGLDQKIATLAAALQNNSASNSGQNTNNYLASDTIHANFGIFEQGIISMGPITSNIITATDQLSVGNSFTITNNAINTVGTDLQIQSLRQGNIAFEGGLIKMDTDGNMLVSGNLNLLGEIDAVHGVFSGTLTAPALATGLISPLPGDDLAIKLSDSASTSGRLKIINQQNEEVLSINSHGDLNASGSGTFAKLNFNLVGKAEATSLTEAVATGSAGFATLRQGQVELTIKNPIITSKSLIYITPYGDTNNKVIYLLRQVPQSEVDDGSFTVGISGTPAPSDIQFNWLVVN